MAQLRLGRWISRIIVAIAIVVMVARIVSTYRVFNDVIDEPYHIGAGIGMFETGRHTYGVQHPPLPRLVGALPLILSGVEDPIVRGSRPIQLDLAAFEIGHRALMQGSLPYWSALVRARAAMLVFPIICVIFVYRLGRYLGDRAVGCAAAVFFSTDPTLLGHAPWVATDVAGCAGYLVATYYGIRCIARPGWKRAIVSGGALGFAIACKFSCAIVVIPLVMILLTRGPRILAQLPRQFGRAAIVIVTAFIVLWASYFFDIGALNDSITLRGSARWARIPAWLKETPIPMPSAILGYFVLSDHNAHGHFSYFNGHTIEGASWPYFPEAIALKSPLALLVGVVVAIVSVVLSRRRMPQRTACVILPGVVFLVATMMSNINIGIRHVLPAIPFLYLFVALWLARRGWRRIVLLILIAMAFIETARADPDYLAFFNAVAGGPRGGERYLLDSNLDWGQDQARLKTWLDHNARGRRVTAQLFGNPRLYEWPREHFDLAPQGSPPSGLFAISKNYLYDVYPSGMTHAWLRKLTPVARIGNSINVYDLTPDSSTRESTSD